MLFEKSMHGGRKRPAGSRPTAQCLMKKSERMRPGKNGDTAQVCTRAWSTADTCGHASACKCACAKAHARECEHNEHDVHACVGIHALAHTQACASRMRACHTKRADEGYQCARLGSILNVCERECAVITHTSKAHVPSCASVAMQMYV